MKKPISKIKKMAPAANKIASRAKKLTSHAISEMHKEIIKVTADNFF